MTEKVADFLNRLSIDTFSKHTRRKSKNIEKNQPLIESVIVVYNWLPLNFLGGSPSRIG